MSFFANVAAFAGGAATGARKGLEESRAKAHEMNKMKFAASSQMAQASMKAYITARSKNSIESADFKTFTDSVARAGIDPGQAAGIWIAGGREAKGAAKLFFDASEDNDKANLLAKTFNMDPQEVINLRMPVPVAPTFVEEKGPSAFAKNLFGDASLTPDQQHFVEGFYNKIQPASESVVRPTKGIPPVPTMPVPRDTSTSRAMLEASLTNRMKKLEGSFSFDPRNFNPLIEYNENGNTRTFDATPLIDGNILSPAHIEAVTESANKINEAIAKALHLSTPNISDEDIVRAASTFTNELSERLSVVDFQAMTLIQDDTDSQEEPTKEAIGYSSYLTSRLEGMDKFIKDNKVLIGSSSQLRGTFIEYIDKLASTSMVANAKITGRVNAFKNEIKARLILSVDANDTETLEEVVDQVVSSGADSEDVLAKIEKIEQKNNAALTTLNTNELLGYNLLDAQEARKVGGMPIAPLAKDSGVITPTVNAKDLTNKDVDPAPTTPEETEKAVISLVEKISSPDSRKKTGNDKADSIFSTMKIWAKKKKGFEGTNLAMSPVTTLLSEERVDEYGNVRSATEDSVALPIRWLAKATTEVTNDINRMINALTRVPPLDDSEIGVRSAVVSMVNNFTSMDSQARKLFEGKATAEEIAFITHLVNTTPVNKNGEASLMAYSQKSKYLLDENFKVYNSEEKELIDSGQQVPGMKALQDELDKPRKGDAVLNTGKPVTSSKGTDPDGLDRQLAQLGSTETIPDVVGELPSIDASPVSAGAAAEVDFSEAFPQLPEEEVAQLSSPTLSGLLAKQIAETKKGSKPTFDFEGFSAKDLDRIPQELIDSAMNSDDVVQGFKGAARTMYEVSNAVGTPMIDVAEKLIGLAPLPVIAALGEGLIDDLSTILKIGKAPVQALFDSAAATVEPLQRRMKQADTAQLEILVEQSTGWIKQAAEEEQKRRRDEGAIQAPLSQNRE